MLSDAEAALDATEIAVRARLGFDAPQATGTVEIQWRNAGAAPTRTAAVFLFANRFESIAGLDDLARHFLLASGTFRPGGTEIVAVTEAGKPLAWNFQDVAGYPPKTVATIDLGRALVACRPALGSCLRRAERRAREPRLAQPERRGRAGGDAGARRLRIEGAAGSGDRPRAAALVPVGRGAGDGSRLRSDVRALPDPAPAPSPRARLRGLSRGRARGGVAPRAARRRGVGRRRAGLAPRR